MLNVQVNNFSVMFGWSHRFLGITSTFFFLGGGGGKYVLLKDTTRQPKLGSNQTQFGFQLLSSEYLKLFEHCLDVLRANRHKY